MRLMPTSMTTAPGLSMAPVIRRGRNEGRCCPSGLTPADQLLRRVVPTLPMKSSLKSKRPPGGQSSPGGHVCPCVRQSPRQPSSAFRPRSRSPDRPLPHASRGAPEGTQPYPGPAGHVKCCARTHTDRATPLSLSLSLSLSACVSGEGVFEGAQGIAEEEGDGHGADAAGDRRDGSARANPAGP
jgi:hypothetical protein